MVVAYMHGLGYVHGGEPLFPSDIWRLACTAWAILGQRPFQDSFLLGPDDATSDQVDALGPLPPEWWEKWEARSKKFTEGGQTKEGRYPWTFNQQLKKASRNHGKSRAWR
ncbi:uncharacterized protein DNG_08251 [Cephalotrichum gorgonifer]|uniref:Protein kinase domain-containing protein n=1 Tax=Cephalotrichum gorgonifer TaxID=2041049 RepID=A0AAE8SY77_9PEZI|nr:uncharacterized protein DNG_08251 [Cephalotrichum gorgonifer]